jgi:predicted CxxxxCH...CXXCH cytochrome family protein
LKTIVLIVLTVFLFAISCSEKNETTAVSVHPNGWNNINSTQFHGKMVLQSPTGPEGCRSCHGIDYSGGESGVACGKCHVGYPHKDGYTNVKSENFHANYIRSISWKLSECQPCHGADYNGGRVNVSCLTCHPAAPEACTVCHGGVDNQTGAPPEDIEGNSATSSLGVGAHSIHLVGGSLSSGFSCNVCHKVPGSLVASGHVDSELPAEVMFSGLSVHDGATALWDGERCSGSYCHGGFELGQSSNAPVWTVVDGSQAVCGSCHGLPPILKHPNLTDCSLCHGMIVDAGKNIIDKNGHTDGNLQIVSDWHDNIFPIYSGNHMNKWQGDCTVCHPTPEDKEIFTCFNCHKHSQQNMDKEHSNVSGYIYDSQACYNCHPTGEAT